MYSLPYVRCFVPSLLFHKISFTVDTEPPRISNCSPSVTVPLLPESNNDYIRHDYTEPTAEDNDGTSPRIIEQTFYPGDALPFGTSVINYTYADQANNTAVCSFDITVTGI